MDLIVVMIVCIMYYLMSKMNKFIIVKMNVLKLIYLCILVMNLQDLNVYHHVNTII